MKTLRSTVGMSPTMRLRFIKRLSRANPGTEVYKYILQQKWVAKDGRSKWLDVPRFDPEQEPADDYAREEG